MEKSHRAPVFLALRGELRCLPEFAAAAAVSRLTRPLNHGLYVTPLAALVAHLDPVVLHVSLLLLNSQTAESPAYCREK